MTTLTKFIHEEQRRFPAATGNFTSLLNCVRLACKRIGFLVGRGAMGGRRLVDSLEPSAPGQGRPATDANEIFLRTTESGGNLAALVSAAADGLHVVPAEYPRGSYMLAFDPLDGAGNLDVNAPAGSIFGVLRAPAGAASPLASDFLRPGVSQVAAGYAIYGPTMMIVLTLGRGVYGFTLDRDQGDFVLTHPDVRIPEETSEIAINAGNERFWPPPVKRYVTECLAGRGGPRAQDFGIRWIASMVAEVHRILIRGGVFVHTSEAAATASAALPHLLCAANPMAMLVEKAGGCASTGQARICDVAPETIGQRVPVILGSRAEVERIEAYYREHALGLDLPFTSPLLRERSLFTPG